MGAGRALRQEHAGFYIDVGAADPVDLSVTKLFYDAGWRGINIEPTPDYAQSLRASRERHITLEVAAGAAPGRTVLHHITGLCLSTQDPRYAARAAEAGFPSTLIEVDVLTLSDICRRHAPPEIHFLKIDVEGAEKAVLEGLDLKAYRPWIIVIEATEPLTPIPSYEAWEPLLIDAAYKFVWFDGLNRFYVSAEKEASLAPAFATPPSVFDDFISVTEADLRTRLAAAEEIATSRAGEFEAQMAAEKRCSEELAAALREEQKCSEELAGALREERKCSEDLAGALREERKCSEDLAGALREEQACSADSARKLKEVKQRLTMIKRSMSWRLTAPLRAANGVLDRWRRRQAAATASR